MSGVNRLLALLTPDSIIPPQNTLAPPIWDVTNPVGTERVGDPVASTAQPGFLPAATWGGQPVRQGFRDMVDQATSSALGWVGQAGPSGRGPGFTAYHGSPHDFPPTPRNPHGEFDPTKIGTGEGAQAYGVGAAYLAEAEGVAREYKGLQGRHSFDPMANVASKTMAAGADVEKRLKQVFPNATADDISAAIERANNPPAGHMYEVQVNADPEHFLHWDKPLYQQSEHVRGALESLGIKTEPRGQWSVKPTAKGDKFTVFNVWGEPAGTFATEAAARAKADAGTASHNAAGGMYAYSQLGGNPAYSSLDKGAASQKLREAGIPGIRYLDQGSRGAGEGTHNYVVFDENTIQILRKYGLAGLIAGAGGVASQQPGNDQGNVP